LINFWVLLGGLKGTELIKRSLIDYYVPFLPLETVHVKECIKDYLLLKGSFSHIIVKKILQTIQAFFINSKGVKLFYLVFPRRLSHVFIIRMQTSC
jgi:hypothetical protein